jgi:hypothetical protein
MTGRIDLAHVAAAVLEETHRGYRVRPQARRMVIGEIRCQAAARHLQGVIVQTVAGQAVAWRPPEEGRKARDVWAEEWADRLEPVIQVTCHCRVNRAVRWADAIG